MAIDEDDDNIDLDITSPSRGRRSSSSDENTVIWILLALAGGLVGGYLLWCFMNERKRKFGYGYGYGYGGGGMPMDGLSRMGAMPMREHPFSEDRNSINIYEAIPRRRPTPLSPGYPSYYENWKVYRDAYGQMVDIRPGDLIGR